MYDIHCKLKSYKLRVLGQLVIQHGIRPMWEVKFSNLTIACLFTQFIKPTCKPKNRRWHLRKGVNTDPYGLLIHLTYNLLASNYIFVVQILVSSYGKLKTNGSYSQLESCEKYHLTMGSLFEYIYICTLLYCMWWEVLSKLLILDFLMENKFSWEGYFQIKFLFKIGMMLPLRNFLYEEIF